MSKPRRGRIGIAESDKSYYVGFWKEDADKQPLGQRLIGYEPKVLGGLAMTGVHIDGVVLQNNKVMALRIPKTSVIKNADPESVENFFREITLNEVAYCFTGRIDYQDPTIIDKVDPDSVDSKFTSLESLQGILGADGWPGDQ